MAQRFDVYRVRDAHGENVQWWPANYKRPANLSIALGIPTDGKGKPCIIAFSNAGGSVNHPTLRTIAGPTREYMVLTGDCNRNNLNIRCRKNRWEEHIIPPRELNPEIIDELKNALGVTSVTICEDWASQLASTCGLAQSGINALIRRYNTQAE